MHTKKTPKRPRSGDASHDNDDEWYTSNYLADLAEREGEAFRTGRARMIEATTDYLETGRLLAEARDACRGSRGARGAFLARADIAETTARLLIRIARADMDPTTLASLGLRGVAKALARPPKPATVADSPLAPPLQANSRGAHGQPDGHPAASAPRIALPNAETPATPTEADRRRAQRARLRAEGRCVDCRAPSDGMARCPKCRTAIAARDSTRREDARWAGGGDRTRRRARHDPAGRHRADRGAPGARRMSGFGRSTVGKCRPALEAGK